MLETSPGIALDRRAHCFGKERNTMDRLDQVKQRLSELSVTIRNANLFGIGLSDVVHEEHQRLTRERERLEGARQIEAARSAATAVLMPTQNIARPFVRALAEHAIKIAVTHGLTVQRSRRASAIGHQRMVFCEPVLTEEAYSTFLHESGHCIEATADSLQQRHFYREHIIAPAAEAAAWRWAIEHALVWTDRMQGDLQEALSTYRPHASDAEIALISQTVGFGFSRVAPAPDTLNGRERRLRQIRRESRVHAIEMDAAAARLRDQRRRERWAIAGELDAERSA